MLINVCTFTDAMKQLKNYTADNKTYREPIKGIHVVYKAGEDQIRFEATNSYILSSVLLGVVVKEGEEPKDIDKIIRPLDYKPTKNVEYVDLDFESMTLWDGFQKIFINDIEEDYPDLQSVMPDPNSYEYEISLSADYLKQVLKSMRKADKVTFRFRGVKPADIIPVNHGEIENRIIISPCKTYK